MAHQPQRSFIELYNQFTKVYDRLTAGRRDMKNFHDLLHSLQQTEERYHKDLEAGLKKQPPELNLAGTLSDMNIAIKSQVSLISKFHQGILVTTYKELAASVDTWVKDIKVNKTKWLDQWTKLCKEVDAKKSAHNKAKSTYEQSVEKAETAVANFRSGRSQVGNDKQVKKLEEAMHTASKELEKSHAAYLKAVSECQQIQLKYESETEKLLVDFEHLETKRLASYQAILTRFVDVQGQHKEQLIQSHEALANTCHKVNPAADIMSFITDAYDGKPLEPHAYYQPKDSEVIPHYGDVGKIQESQQHLQGVLENHRRLMVNSTHQPATYNVPNANGTTTSLTSAPSFVGQPSNAAFTAPAPGANLPHNDGVISTSFNQPQQFNQPPQQTAKNLRSTALYDFNGTEAGDLTFMTNNVIQLVSCDPEDDWWTGTLNGITGSFPKSYVTPPVEIPSDQPTSTQPIASAAPTQTAQPSNDGALFICRAEFPFEGQEADELTLRVGDILTVYALVEDWYEGVNAAGQRGIFPANHVEKQ